MLMLLAHAFVMVIAAPQQEELYSEIYEEDNGGGVQVFGASVAVDRFSMAPYGFAMAVGAPGDDSNGMVDSGRVYLYENGQTSPSLTASGANPGDEFGQVALHDDTLVVSAWKADGSGMGERDFGAITVFRRNSTLWSEEHTYSADELQSLLQSSIGYTLQEFDRFGEVGVFEDRIILGSRLADNGGMVDVGAAFVLERNGPSWDPAAMGSGQPTVSRLLPDPMTATLQSGDNFGSVAIHGDYAVVGARRHDVGSGLPCPGVVTGSCEHGAAFVFHKDPMTGFWEEVALLEAQFRPPSGAPISDANYEDEFGFSVAIYDNIIAIGAPGRDLGCGGQFGVAEEVNCDTGAVYVFERPLDPQSQPGDWEIAARITVRQNYRDGDFERAQAGVPRLPTAFERFGYSVAVHGGRIVVGAPGRFELVDMGDGSTLVTGAAYVFERLPSDPKGMATLGTWQSTRYLTEYDLNNAIPGDGEQGAFFGSSVDAAWAHIAIGAPLDSSPGSLLAGKAYGIYQLPEFDVHEHEARCFGDGGDQMGCTDCPCANNVAAGTGGGCVNAENRSARLFATGLARIGAGDDSLRFEVVDASSSTFALLACGDNLLPSMGTCPPGSGGNGGAMPSVLGLRCIGGNFQRLGTRMTDSDGSVGPLNRAWGAPNEGAVGEFTTAMIGAVGVTRHFQVFYRDVEVTACIGGIGSVQSNTTNAVSVVILP